MAQKYLKRAKNERQFDKRFQQVFNIVDLRNLSTKKQ